MKVVILMGGKSHRMGKDKALVTYRGQTLLESAVKLAKQIDEEFYLSLSHEQFETFGHEYRCIIDAVADRGPLVGISSALVYLREDILVIPIDMPNITIDVLEQLIASGKTSAYQVKHWIQALPSYWSFKDLGSIQHALNNDLLNLKSFFEENVNLIPFNGDEKIFLNVNRPEDLK